MKAPITSAQAMQHPTVVATINTLSQLAEKLRVEHDALLDRVEKAEKDAARLDWLQTKLFTQRWNGAVGQGCLTQWNMAPDYRHSLNTMQTGDFEIDFRGAIDNAMEASK